jgi:hypothetical protein
MKPQSRQRDKDLNEYSSFVKDASQEYEANRSVSEMDQLKKIREEAAELMLMHMKANQLKQQQAIKKSTKKQKI